MSVKDCGLRRSESLFCGRPGAVAARGACARGKVPMLVDLYMCGELKIDEYITHNMEFSQINEALGTSAVPWGNFH